MKAPKESVGSDGQAPKDNAPTEWGSGSLVETAAIVGVVAAGAALFEAALIPGILIGVGAMLVPKILPGVSGTLQSGLRATVRGVYHVGNKASHVLAEAQEQIHDAVAEVKAENSSHNG
jgi:CO/xanthine dehydrogenase Mo-binding subunit